MRAPFVSPPIPSSPERSYPLKGMHKKRIALLALTLWLILIIAFMLLARTLDLEIFFVLWLIGILVVVELVSGASATPGYLKYLRFVIAAGVIIFGAIVAQKVLEILSR
jgi:hypothetical protein